MWVEQLKNGGVRYVERFEHPMTGKMMKLSVTMERDTRANRKLALATLQDKYEQKLGTILVTARKRQLRLLDLVELYRTDQKHSVSSSTYRRNYYTANTLMKVLGEETLVDRLTAGYVKECLSNQKNKASGAINEQILRLKALLRWGYENDYIDDIRWLDKLRPLPDDRRVQKLQTKYLEGDELKLLLNSMKHQKWRFLTELTALSGLRSGEAIALERKDVDIDQRVIHVTKTYDANNKIITAPKTASSVRDVYMQDELLALCRQIKAYMGREKLRQGYRTKLFLCDGCGEHLSYYAYNKYLREKSEKLFGRSITTHFMRHTHVALMAEQGVSLDIISRRLGHANSKVTKQIYFHVTEKLKEKENEEIRQVRIL